MTASDDRITLTQLAQQERVSAVTVWRWAQRGVRGVRLGTFCIGGRRFTDPASWDKFVEQVTVASGAVDTGTQANRQREAAIVAAEADLARAGI